MTSDIVDRLRAEPAFDDSLEAADCIVALRGELESARRAGAAEIARLDGELKRSRAEMETFRKLDAENECLREQVQFLKTGFGREIKLSPRDYDLVARLSEELERLRADQGNEPMSDHDQMIAMGF